MNLLFASFPSRFAARIWLHNPLTPRPVHHTCTRMLAAKTRRVVDSPERQVVLLSGGVESSTLLHIVKQEYDEVVGLFFRYGQRAVEQEQGAAQMQCRHAGVNDFLVADLTSVGESLRARQKERLHVPLRHRNLVLLSVAVSVAAQEGGRVWIAVCEDDLSWYPSASAEFLDSFKSCARTLGVEVETPLKDMGKKEVVRKGLESGVVFKDTWSCMIGRGRACGRCVQCRARKKAFLECGLDGFT